MEQAKGHVGRVENPFQAAHHKSHRLRFTPESSPKEGCCFFLVVIESAVMSQPTYGDPLRISK